MSLLMDALKRAETSKQEAARAAAETEAPAPADKLSLEPISTATPGASALPDLASHSDALDAELAASAAPPPQRPSAPKLPPAPPTLPAQPPSVDEGSRAAARNAFAAKQPEPPSRAPMWLALGVLGLAAVGIGAYVLFQVQSMGGGSLVTPPAGIASVAPPPRQALPAPAAVVPPIPLPPSASPAATAVLPPISPSTAPAPILETRSPRMSRPDIARGVGEAPGAAVPIRLTRSRPEPDGNAQRGYASLQGNHIEQARHDYDQALKADPNNVDALLALAAIAQSQGRPGDAERYRQRAYEANPSDPAAQAAMLGVNAGGDPAAIESRLKTLLSAQPESAPLNFALGNLYSRQGRWAEAQQAYFNAVAGDAENPDYLFNLAVSLDHLRQQKLAAQHYRLALDAAQRRPSAFDRERVKVRLSELQL